jgi:hypothetical protein
MAAKDIVIEAETSAACRSLNSCAASNLWWLELHIMFNLQSQREGKLEAESTSLKPIYPTVKWIHRTNISEARTESRLLPE